MNSHRTKEGDVRINLVFTSICQDFLNKSLVRFP